MGQSTDIADLSRKSKHALVWAGLELLLRQGIRFVISIILARLLQPEEFGLIGMLALFIGIASSFVDCGFSSALIQRKQPTPADTSSVFYFNVAMAMVMALLLAAAAPWIAAFYHMPILKALTWVMALNLFLGSLRSIHEMVLTKALDFRTQMKATVAATLISGAAGIYWAWRGWGVWALAWQTVVSTVVSNLMLWHLCKWRPSFCFSWTSLRSLFRYGSFMFAAGLLDTAYTRAYTMIIGRMYSPRDLGYFTRADQTQHLPSATLPVLLGRVAFPVFVAASGDRSLLLRALRKALTGVMLVNVPIMLGMLATARPLVLFLFGEKWLPCVPYLQVLSLAGVLWPLHIVNLNLLKSEGRSDLFFRLEVMKKSLGLIALVVAAQISILAMAWSQVILGVVFFFINAHYSGRIANYSVWAQLRDLLPCLLAAAGMLGCAWPVLLITPATAPTLTLAIQVLLGFGVYCGLCLALQPRGTSDIVAQVKTLWLALGRSKRCEA